MAIKTTREGFLSADEVFKIVEPMIVEIEDQSLNDARLEEDLASMLGFTDFRPSTKKGLIQTKLGIVSAPEVGERDSYTLQETNYGPSIGYGLTRFFPGSEMTSEAKKWILAGGKEADLTDAVATELQLFGNETKDALNSIRLSENEYILKTIVSGFGKVTSAYGPNSAVYDGMPLFSKSHKVIKTDETYSNIVDDGAGNHAPLSYTSLKKAVDMLRKMKDGQGVRVKRPSNGIYDLYVSPELEQTALEVLSDANGFSPYNYTGALAGNNNFINVFNTNDGFKVRLNVIDLLNQADGRGNTIGSATMWFVINKEMVMRRNAFRRIILGDTKISMHDDPKTNGTYATVEKHFGAQILYPEVIVGSKGDSSRIA